MADKKKLVFLFSLMMLRALLLSDWQEVVKRHLGTFLVYDKLAGELTARFDDIEEEEKGAASLILAYSYEQLQKNRVVSPAVEDFFDKSAAQQRRDTGMWLKKFFEEFNGRDENLLFLLPDRETLREDILAFREKSRTEFPIVKIETETYNLESFIKIKLRITSSINCGYEICAEDSVLLAAGELKKGMNERIVQVKKKTGGNRESFIKLLAFNKYLNEKKIAFVYFDLLPGELKNRRKSLPGKFTAPKLLIGAALMLINSQVVNRRYFSDSVLPQTKANLDSSLRLLDTMAFGLIATGFIDLGKKKGLYNTGTYEPKTYFGLSWSPAANHDYYVYKRGIREPAGLEETVFFENDFSFSVLLRQHFELGLFYRKFRADNAPVAGGLWSIKKSLCGFTLGKVFTVADPAHTFPVDFSGGGFISYGFDRHYTFKYQNKNDNAATRGDRLTYGLYAAVQLRFNLLRKIKKPELPIITVGFKYFFPFNDFEYNTAPDAVYRLQREFFFIGFYFR